MENLRYLGLDCARRVGSEAKARASLTIELTPAHIGLCLMISHQPAPFPAKSISKRESRDASCKGPLSSDSNLHISLPTDPRHRFDLLLHLHQSITPLFISS